jgi:hypothetical protein
MIHFSSRLRAAWLAVLVTLAVPALGLELTDDPVFELTSSGLLTYSIEDRALRVAIVFAEKDEAVVPTVVRFIDAKGNVLKRVRGDLHDGQPIVAELTRRDVGPRSDLLVRVEVVHKLPGVRAAPYPILVTTQAIAIGGFARVVLPWKGGKCGLPPNTSAAPAEGGGEWVDCDPELPTDI